MISLHSTSSFLRLEQAHSKVRCLPLPFLAFEKGRLRKDASLPWCPLAPQNGSLVGPTEIFENGLRLSCDFYRTGVGELPMYFAATGKGSGCAGWARGL